MSDSFQPPAGLGAAVGGLRVDRHLATDLEDNTACQVDRIELPSVGHVAIEASRELADHTTLRVGGPADDFVVATTVDASETTAARTLPMQNR